jgi:hypothetical protein
MTTFSNYNEDDINREVITASSIIHQAATEIDENLKLRSYTYIFNKNKLTVADSIVLSLAAMVKELASNGSNTNK